ncbi:MAG: hypothetical protein AAB552_02285 [Patescibacteria group bacterium]
MSPLFKSSQAPQNRGFGLIEIITGAGIISLVMLSVFFFFQKTLELSNFNRKIVEADLALTSSVEIVGLLRAEGWTSLCNGLCLAGLTPGVSYYLSFSGSRWSIVAPYTLDGYRFERKVVTAYVNRDAATKDIVTAGGADDPNTRKVTISVSWAGKNGTTTKSVVTYMTNFWNVQ